MSFSASSTMNSNPLPNIFVQPQNVVGPLGLKTLNQADINAEAQIQGAPTFSKLRRALNHVTTVAANEDNPATRRMMIRSAMEGAGTAMSDTSLAAHKAALATVGKNVDIENQGILTAFEAGEARARQAQSIAAQEAMQAENLEAQKARQEASLLAEGTWRTQGITAEKELQTSRIQAQKELQQMNQAGQKELQQMNQKTIEENKAKDWANQYLLEYGKNPNLLKSDWRVRRAYENALQTLYGKV